LAAAGKEITPTLSDGSESTAQRDSQFLADSMDRIRAEIEMEADLSSAQYLAKLDSMSAELDWRTQQTAAETQSILENFKPTPQPGLGERLWNAAASVVKQQVGQRVGVLETVWTVGSSAVAEVAGGVSGVATLLLTGGDLDASVDVINGVRNKITYQPRTSYGEATLSTLGSALAPVANGIEYVNSSLGDAAYEQFGPLGGAIGYSLLEGALALAAPEARAAFSSVSHGVASGARAAGINLLDEAFSGPSFGSMAGQRGAIRLDQIFEVPNKLTPYGTTLESEIRALRNFGANRSGVHTDITIRSEFAALSPQIADNNIPLIKAYSAWKNQDWQKLESIFPAGDWPPYRGFVTRSEGVLEPGMLFDRFGGRFKNGAFSDRGSFVSPAGASFTSRGLPDSTLDAPMSVYEVLKPIKGHQGPAIPWFKQEGMGIQWELNNSIDYLLKNDYIRLINRTAQGQ
jgi:hypothetical protein